MKRRHDESEPPAELVEFDGIALGYTTPDSWRAALDQWEAARRRWAKAHGIEVDDLPAKIGDEPWDPSLL